MTPYEIVKRHCLKLLKTVERGSILLPRFPKTTEDFREKLLDLHAITDVGGGKHCVKNKGVLLDALLSEKERLEKILAESKSVSESGVLSQREFDAIYRKGSKASGAAAGMNGLVHMRLRRGNPFSQKGDVHLCLSEGRREDMRRINGKTLLVENYNTFSRFQFSGEENLEAVVFSKGKYASIVAKRISECGVDDFKASFDWDIEGLSMWSSLCEVLGRHIPFYSLHMPSIDIFERYGNVALFDKQSKGRIEIFPKHVTRWIERDNAVSTIANLILKTGKCVEEEACLGLKKLANNI